MFRPLALALRLAGVSSGGEVVDEFYRQKGRVRDVGRLRPLTLDRLDVAARQGAVVRDVLTGPVRTLDFRVY